MNAIFQQCIKQNYTEHKNRFFYINKVYETLRLFHKLRIFQKEHQNIFFKLIMFMKR